MGRAAHLLTEDAVCRSAATTCATVGGVCSFAPSPSRRDQCGLAAAPRRINKTEIGFRRQQHRALAPVPQKRAATTRTFGEACVNVARRMASTARFISHLPPWFPRPSIPHPPIPHPSIPPFQESTEGSSRRRPTFSVNVTTSRARTLEERASGHRARAGTGVRCEAHGEHCKIVSWSSSLLLHSQFRPLQPKRQRAFAGIFHTLCRAGRDFHLHSICTPLRVIHRALRCHPDFS